MKVTENKTTAPIAALVAVLVLLPPLAVRPIAAVLANPNPQAVAEIVAGRRSEARVSWWGFDPEDATAVLQAAINSGARRLIVEDMGAPWITDKLTLASNQEIVFEEGVVVLAKRGAFRGGSDCLFTAASKTNITLIGPGATLRMRKQDYDNKAQYKHAEWRHVLSFTSCSGIRVEGLTLADSGGDGVYLGVAQKGVPCSDVIIKNVSCVNNYRQGISVISARNLLIEGCVLKGTSGTAPEAGIDFEPNEATEELANCLMRNCMSEGNGGMLTLFTSGRSVPIPSQSPFDWRVAVRWGAGAQSRSPRAMTVKQRGSKARWNSSTAVLKTPRKPPSLLQISP